MTSQSLALTTTFLAECLSASLGVDMPHARQDAQALLCVGVAMGLITKATLDLWEQDARILELRGQGISGTTIALRLGISRATVHAAIKRHQGVRRTALLLVG